MFLLYLWLPEKLHALDRFSPLGSTSCGRCLLLLGRLSLLLFLIGPKAAQIITCGQQRLQVNPSIGTQLISSGPFTNISTASERFRESLHDNNYVCIWMHKHCSSLWSFVFGLTLTQTVC